METATLGFAMCGSFCTFDTVLKQLERLHEEYPNIVPIMSEAAYTQDTRFGAAAQQRARLEAVCGRPVLHTLQEVEPIGPKGLLDALIVCPCTGSTLGKLASGVADGPVTLAVKAHLRNEAPVILAISTNDALAGNAQSIGQLLNRRHYYFVPFRQDAPFQKPRSMVADFSMLTQTVRLALHAQQLQPIVTA